VSRRRGLIISVPLDLPAWEVAGYAGWRANFIHPSRLVAPLADHL
jgi:hypothetical protein